MLPKVVIVGRANVGKSTLFNRLSHATKSLVFDVPGVTRDFITDTVTWLGTTFELIDSGGIELKKTADYITQKVQDIGMKLIEEADVALFMIDASVGILEQDRMINQLLYKVAKKVVVVANKSDTAAAKEHRYEIEKLGRPFVEISALQGTGSGDLLDYIVQELGEKKGSHTPEEPKCTLVILGKPNVGKSSLMNALLAYERSIVTEQAGTTREAVTANVHFYKETLELTDTPGIRRKRSVTQELEQMMVKTSLRSVDRADIVLFVVDGSQMQLSDQELKLLFFVFEQRHKAVILLINKDDLLDTPQHEVLSHDFSQYDYILKKIPSLYISCTTGKNIGKILPLVQKVWQRYTAQLPSADMSLLLKQAFTRRPLYHQGKLLSLSRAEQVHTRPPKIVVYVNEPRWFGPSQCAFLENVLRKKYDLQGVPVILIPTKKS